MAIKDPYKFTPIGLGAYLVDTATFEDNRGWFGEMWSSKLFKKNGINFRPKQMNSSLTKKGALRGLHFQREPHSQARIFRCATGKIFDVAVDVRRESPTFGQHVTATISADSRKALYLPRGFANAIIGMSDEDATVYYLVDAVYSKNHETGLLWNDPELHISYPLVPTIISDKDKNWKTLKELEL